VEAKPRLLVVEDDPAILDLLSAALRFAGFEVTTAITASEAFKTVAVGPPDLMLLDIMLPDQDGFEVLRRIRGQGIGCPVLFLTARDGVADRVGGRSAGAAD
jgi:two-component system OmpR family response regulator